MNLKEAEAMVEKLLPEWSSTVSSNFDGFANLLLDDCEDWARDTLKCVLDPCEDDFDRTLDAWELVAVRYFTAMCRPVPSFKTADGVTCYVGDFVYCKDGEQHEVTEVCLNGEIVRIGVGNGEDTITVEAAMVTFYQPEPPRSLKTMREQVQSVRKAQREAVRAKSNELQSAKLAEALNNRGSYHERLIKVLTEGAGHVGIVSKYAFSNIGETFPESEEGAKALKWWTDREVSYKFTASGLVLYIGPYHSNWHDLKYIDYQAWDND